MIVFTNKIIMKNSLFKFVLCLLLFVKTDFILSQTVNTQLDRLGLNTITTSVPFLTIAPDSRSGGMGDVGVATSPDANSMHWNPSKYAFADKKVGLSVCYTPWLRALVPDISLSYLAGYYKLNKNQVVAGSLRYFSLGDITFTDNAGNTTGQFRPNEFAFDVAFAQKLAERWSGAMALRYIYSNLTGGTFVSGTATHPGNSVAADISTFYQNKDIVISGKKSIVAAGLNISNIGAKISYSGSSGKKDFIPINMRLGSSLTMALDDYNTISFNADVNKLLVPTPPVYDTANGGPKIGPDGNYVILSGQNPNRGVASGIFGSFNDAPGGAKEELHEIMYSVGTEYWYDKLFAVRAGYFYEHPTKGNRKFFTVGIGIRYNVFGLDFAYLIPSKQKNPLENTLRFSLLFDFDAFKSQNKEEVKAD